MPSNTQNQPVPDLPLNIYNVEPWRQHLLDLLVRNKTVSIDLGQVEACDSAGIQVLCSAGKSAVESGRVFQVTQFSPAVQRALQAVGLSEQCFARREKEVAS